MTRPATEQDIHDLAQAMPGVTVTPTGPGLPVYQVSRKSFVFFRSARPDALDPDTGERLTDVVVFWVPDAGTKEALVAEDGPFFTTPHFNGHPSVLLRLAHLGRLDRDELAEIVADAWLARAPKRAAAKWLAEQEAGRS